MGDDEVAEGSARGDLKTVHRSHRNANATERMHERRKQTSRKKEKPHHHDTV